MDKRIVWNEALAAYNIDLDVLEVTRNDYIRFVSQTVEDVAKRVKSLSGGKIEPLVRPAEDLTSALEPDVEWRPRGTRALGGLAVQAFPTAGRGGAPGSFFVEIWLDTSSDVPRELGVTELRAALLDAVAALPGELMDPAKRANDAHEDVVDLRLIGVDFAAPDLVEQLAHHFITYAEAANRLTDEIARAPRGADPNRWARLRLLEVRNMLAEEIGTKATKSEWDPSAYGLGDWEDGRFLGVEKSTSGKDDALWVCAMENGDVVFAANGPTTSNKARWKALMAIAKGGTRTFDDGPGATLLDAAAVAALAKEGNTRGLCDLVMALFREFVKP